MKTLSWSRLRRPAIIAAAMLISGWNAGVVSSHALAVESAGAWRDDCDIVMLRKGLDRTPRLRDTLQWFTGEWIGCNPFWRPLSSYGFWLMNRILGWGNFRAWTLVPAAFHVLVAVLLFLLVEGLTGRPLAGLAAVALNNIGSPGRLGDIYTSAGLRVVGKWIYFPDVWLAACVLPALLLAWRGRIWWALVLAVAAAMVKETGFMAFPLVGGIYWWRQRRWHSGLWILVAVAAGLAALRLVVVGPGWVLGSNRWVWLRIWRFVQCRPLNVITTGMAPWGLLGIGLGAAAITRRGPRVRAAMVIGGLVLAAGAFAIMKTAQGTRLGPAAGIAGLLEPTRVFVVLGVAVWLVMAWAGLRGRYHEAMLILAIAYLAMGIPPTIAPQSGQRSLYTPWLLSAAISAICLWSLPAAFRRSASPRCAGADSDAPPATHSITRG
ncbi:MAG: hypothetical protein U9R79_06925 [Armatimonadota bacterium]|nr:hypothetical protein [Armatimonadota bacterium]